MKCQDSKDMEAETLRSWLQTFDSALVRKDADAAARLFCEGECFWRDLVSFTWNLFTAESRDEIRAMLKETLEETQPHLWTLEKELPPENGITCALIRFETRRARCRGHVRMKDGKCWTLTTAMEELKGYEEKAGPRRENGVQHGALKGRKTWLDLRKEEQDELGTSRQPYCVIVGGGQGGIALGARLRRLGVATIILEKNERPGDSWRNRYKSLCLHDTVWFDHLPYLSFPDHWPVFSSKDKIADWLEAYTTIMELVYWSSSECTSARFNELQETWDVIVDRHGEQVILHPKHLVLATGMSGVPNVPKFSGSETFQGLQCHSSQHRGGEEWEGKHCVVIGSNNSAHDICADLWEHGAAQVTMVQRSSTHVARSESLLSLGLGNYCEGSPYSTAEADLIFASVPCKLLRSFNIPLSQKLAEIDAAFYERLAEAGFMHDFGDDGSGVLLKYLRRGSGYYIDVGASELVMNREIQLKSGVEVQEVKPASVVFTDGSEVDADLIVYATGYGSMNGWAAKLISQEVADKVGKCWGLGSDTRKDPGPWERELRNMWKPTQQTGLWFHGGSLQQSRQYSLLLALQIKARMEGIPTPVYGVPEVHHRS